MYVVRRPFRNFGKVITVGSVIAEPTGIKHFKRRVFDRYIVDVNDQNFDTYKNYFAQKFGIDIKLPEAELIVSESAEAKTEASAPAEKKVVVAARLK
jgi:hypothetical protein